MHKCPHCQHQFGFIEPRGLGGGGKASAVKFLPWYGAASSLTPGSLCCGLGINKPRHFLVETQAHGGMLQSKLIRLSWLSRGEPGQRGSAGPLSLPPLSETNWGTSLRMHALEVSGRGPPNDNQQIWTSPFVVQHCSTDFTCYLERTCWQVLWCVHTRARQRQDKSWTCAFLWCLSHQVRHVWCERHHRNAQVQHLSCRCLVVVLLWCENTTTLWLWLDPMWSKRHRPLSKLRTWQTVYGVNLSNCQLFNFSQNLKKRTAGLFGQHI